jgi:uncharacterized protein with PQ loop repeat
MKRVLFRWFWMAVFIGQIVLYWQTWQRAHIGETSIVNGAANIFLTIDTFAISCWICVFYLVENIKYPSYPSDPSDKGLKEERLPNKVRVPLAIICAVITAIVIYTNMRLWGF